MRGAVFKASDVGLSNLGVDLGHRPNTSNRQTELETAKIQLFVVHSLAWPLDFVPCGTFNVPQGQNFVCP